MRRPDVFKKGWGKHLRILSLESSCDETAAAVVSFSETERSILSSAIASQVEIHALYGGVVPEIAGRAHIEAISGLVYRALEEAGISADELDAVAVTSEPGLIGALLVAVNFAKAFAFAHRLPLIPVNHIRGHVAAAYFAYPDLKAPFFAMVASGGHTSLIDVRSPVEFVTVGKTRDDAIGEAFDKVARVLGMPYPGGAEIDRLASRGDPDAIAFPSAALRGSLDFSFSGLKTAVINYVHGARQRGALPELPAGGGEGADKAVADIAASFTAAVVRAVISHLEKAHARFGYKTLVAAGGVAANSHLRSALTVFCEKQEIRLCLPPLSLCGDNAAMIGAQGYYEFMAGHLAGSDLNARPTVRGAD